MDNIVKTFATDLLRPRRYHYSQEPLEQFLTVNSEVKSYNFRIPNHQGNLLDTLLLKKGSSSTCILYAHGLGSNKLEALSVAKYYLKQKYDICSFDFSGSGRSQGTCISYGINEKQDLLAVLRHLEASQQYKRIILWGRSMGAVAVVLSQELQQNRKVDCIILDSPFCSFQKIAIEIASKRSFVPQFMLEVVIQPLKDYFKNHCEVNPFTVDLQNAMKKINANMMLIYSENDSVVSSSHSKTIIKCCRRNPAQIVIKQDHNMKRSKSTHQKTLNFIRDSGKQIERRVLLSRNKNRGISVASRDAKDKQSVRNNSSSKIRVLQPSFSKLSARQPSTKPQRHIRTVASMSINDSTSFNKRLETEQSPIRRRMATISSVLFEKNKLVEERLLGGANKENKPSLNLMRRLNRFR